MSTAAKTIVMAALIASAGCSTAHGQALSYHHRSTPEGDIRSGMADQQRAWGASARDWAEGYGLYMSAEERLLLLNYQAYEIRRRIEQDRLESVERKNDYCQHRAAERAAERDAAARRLLVELQLGVHRWPEALVRPEYVSSLRVIEGVLHNWGQADYETDAFARRALATEAGVLRSRVAANRQISFPSRLAAVRALKLVQRVAMDATVQSPLILAANR